MGDQSASRQLASHQVEQDLKYFIGCALTGILANSAFNNPGTQKYLQSKGLTQEKLAVLAGMEIVQQLEIMKKEMASGVEVKEKPTLVVFDT